MFHNWMWGGGMWFGWIFWLVIIGLIVWLLINQSNRSRNQTQDQMNPHLESPLDILKKRYAKGEITKEQFEEMKKDLQ
jgi:putative membrane protein